MNLKYLCKGFAPYCVMKLGSTKAILQLQIEQQHIVITHATGG